MAEAGAEAPAGEQEEEAVRSVDERGYRHVLVRGVVYPPFANHAAIDGLRAGFKLRDTDIVIATYPKCGTTWMQQIVLSLLFGGDRSKVPEPMVQAPWLECAVSAHANGKTMPNAEPRSRDQLLAWDGATAGAPAPSRRVFKTHAPVEILPWSGGLDLPGDAKVIVVVRNPKDACVSMYHHSRDVPAFEYTGDFEHFVPSLFLRGKVESGCFWRWHAGWWKACEDNRKTLWISYEDLKLDPVAGVRRIAAFLGVPAPDEVVRLVVGASSFDAMKASFEETASRKAAAGKPVKRNHIRRGEMGTWREMLRGPLLEAFDRAHEERTAELGLSYSFDFGSALDSEPASKQPRTE